MRRIGLSAGVSKPTGATFRQAEGRLSNYLHGRPSRGKGRFCANIGRFHRTGFPLPTDGSAAARVFVQRFRPGYSESLLMSESIQIALCRNALAAGAVLTLHVRGTSMIPALWPGECVRVEPPEGDELRLGRVVAFARDHHIVVHRIVGVAKDADGVTLITRGDAQFHDDRPVHASDVLGVASTVRRFGTDWRLGLRPSAAARGLSRIVRHSAMARFLLGAVSSKLSIGSTSAHVRIAR